MKNTFVFQIFITGKRCKPNPLMDEKGSWTEYFENHDAVIIIEMCDNGQMVMRVKQDGMGRDHFTTTIPFMMREILFRFGIDPQIVNPQIESGAA